MTVLVWVDGWQMECCGEPFGVGDEVLWRLDAPDVGWLRTVVGADVAARIAYADERHADGPYDRPPRPGRVVSLAAASCRYELAADGRTLHPVPGTAVLRDVAHVHDRAPARGRFHGWVVGVDLQDG